MWLVTGKKGERKAEGKLSILQKEKRQAIETSKF
jgi:hypothetical protein